MGSHVPKVCFNITRCTKVFHNMYHKMHHDQSTHHTIYQRRIVRPDNQRRPWQSPFTTPHPDPSTDPLPAPSPPSTGKVVQFFSVSCQPNNPTQLKLNLEWKKTTPHPNPSTAPQARRKSGPMFSSNCCTPIAGTPYGGVLSNGAELKQMNSK